jgi:hypothetical protein
LPIDAAAPEWCSNRVRASPALEECLRASTLTLAYYVLKAAGFGGLFLRGSADA